MQALFGELVDMLVKLVCDALVATIVVISSSSLCDALVSTVIVIASSALCDALEATVALVKSNSAFEAFRARDAASVVYPLLVISPSALILEYAMFSDVFVSFNDTCEALVLNQNI